MMKRLIITCALCFLCLGLSACGSTQNELTDGYYTAEMSDYEHGWKEFVTICVNNGKIAAVEFNARDASGFIKAWDMDYMKNMNSQRGTYPNAYTRAYAASLLESQDAEQIDAVTGATHSGGNFGKMASLLIEKAKAGDTSLGIVQVEES